MTENFTPAKAGTQRPRLSKEEYAEKKRAEKDGVYQLADEAAKEIVSSPEKFKAFLDTQSRLDRYSAVNALLIYKQYPQAVQLKDFDDWSKDNIKITKGAKSISILEPVEYAKRDGTTGISYNVKKVFDVSQTNGKRPPAPTANRDPKALITTMLHFSSRLSGGLGGGGGERCPAVGHGLLRGGEPRRRRQARAARRPG